MRLSRTLRYAVASVATLALMLGVLGTAHAGGIDQGTAESLAERAVGSGSMARDISDGTAGGAAVWNVDVRSSQGVWYAVQIAQVDGVVMRLQVLAQVPSANSGVSQPSGSSIQAGSESSGGSTVPAETAPPSGRPPTPRPHAHPHPHPHGGRVGGAPRRAHLGRHSHFGFGHAKGPGNAQGDDQGD